MATDSGYEKGNYLRVCDICGHRFHFRDLKPIGELRFACPDDAPGLTAMQISRFNARARPLIVRPNKWAKDYSQTGIYQLAEGQIFNFIASVAPAGERDGASDPLSAAWASIYMAEVMRQDKRPLYWERTATSTITRCCDYLLTLQYGAPDGANPTGTIDNPRYGGILFGTTRSTATTIAAGVAFLKAYQALGTSKYLDGARKVATFLRHAQSGNVQATKYTVYPAGGGAYYIGGLASSLDDSSGLLNGNYNVSDIVGAWFLTLLRAQLGDLTYGDAAATAFFTAPTAVPLSTMIADLTAFGEVGARDHGLIVCPLSSTAPKLNYTAALAGVGGAAAWADPGLITTRELALALLGIYSANGNTAKVVEMMAWLAAFTSNAANQTPSNLREDLILEGITGTYDPTLCPADTLAETAPFIESDGALYDWSSFGILAPILAGNQAAMRRSKDTLSASVRYSYFDVTNVYLGPIGSSGLTLQPFFRNAAGGLVGVSGATGTTPGTSVSSPPETGLVFWVKGDAGLESSGGLLTAWRDQGPLHQDLDTTDGNAPSVGLDSINGIPAVSFPLGNNSKYIRSTATMKDRNGNPFTAALNRTVFAMVLPQLGNVGFPRVGGAVFSFRETPCFECLFSLESFFHVDGMYLFDNAWPYSGGQLLGPDTDDLVYADKPTLVMWTGAASTGSLIGAAINGTSIVLSPSTSAGVVGASGPAGFLLGNADNATGTPQANNQGAITEVVIYDYVLTGAVLSQVLGYFASRYTSAPIAVVAPSSVVRAARTGLAYRQAPGRYPFLRGN